MIFKIEVYAYFRAENLVAKGNIAQFEQYFLWQQCFQMLSAAVTDYICSLGVKELMGSLTENNFKNVHVMLWLGKALV